MGNIHRQRDERNSTANHPKALKAFTFFVLHSLKVRTILPDTSIGVEVPMAEMIHVSEDTFKNEVLDLSEPVLVDFSAVWCQPCKMLDPSSSNWRRMGWKGQGRKDRRRRESQSCDAVWRDGYPHPAVFQERRDQGTHYRLYGQGKADRKI